jgi:SPP1 family predicted phage head-tail adaptor
MLQAKEQVGKLDRQITFQQRIIGENVSNEDEETGWEDIDSNPEVWAEVEEKSGTEEFKSDQLKDVLISNFTIRYRSDINAKMRISYDGRKYNIQSIVDIGRKRFRRIVAHSGMTAYQETET